jgi:hypothetical protein
MHQEINFFVTGSGFFQRNNNVNHIKKEQLRSHFFPPLFCYTENAQPGFRDNGCSEVLHPQDKGENRQNAHDINNQRVRIDHVIDRKQKKNG